MRYSLTTLSPAGPVRSVAGSLCVSLVLAACGAPEGDPAVRTADAQSPTRISDAQAAATGTLELDGTTFEFRITTCDLTGNRPDGMLLKGAGTAPDGRRLTVEAERLAPGEITWERATMYFGSIIDGDHWTASLRGWPDGRWFADEAGEVAVAGPLLQVSGSTLLVEGTFQHETNDSTKEGVLRATCPA